MQEIPQAVAVTGAAGYIGGRLMERLLSEDAIHRVVGIDIRPAPLEHPKLIYLRQDINAPLEVAFRDAGIEAVVHLAFAVRQLRSRSESKRINVGGMTNVVRACHAAAVRRLVVMSSFSVYGPNSGGSTPFTEASPLRPPLGFHYAVDKAACEALCSDYAATHPGVQLTVLRGCVVMGPHANNSITASLSKPVLIGIRGADPGMQFVHEDDLVEVLWEAIGNPRPGAYNVAGEGAVPWSEVVSMGGKRLVILPAPIAYGLLAATWRLRLQNDSPSAGLAFIHWPWTVSTEKLRREFDYQLRYTSREALLDCLSPTARC